MLTAQRTQIDILQLLRYLWLHFYTRVLTPDIYEAHCTMLVIFHRGTVQILFCVLGPHEALIAGNLKPQVIGFILSIH